MSEFFKQLLMAGIVGLFLLVVRVVSKAVFNEVKRRNSDVSEFRAVAVAGRVLWFLIAGVLIYGFLLRPMLSEMSLRDEVAVLDPARGSISKMYDIDLRRGTRDVIKMDFETVEGGPINVFLVPYQSVKANVDVPHVPSFSVLECDSGSTSARVTPGLWSIVISCADGNRAKTRINVKTSVTRARFFQKVSSAVASGMAFQGDVKIRSAKPPGLEAK